MKTHIKNQLKLFLSLIILGFLMLNVVNTVNAQEGDTTKLKFKNKKILIIEDKQDIEKGIEDLKKGLDEFKTNVDAYKLQIKVLKDSVNVLKESNVNIADEVKKAENQNEIEKKENKIIALEKKIEAFEKGISQIEEELADMENELKDMDKNPKFKNWESKKKPKKFKGHWAGFEFGLNNFTNSDHRFELSEDADFMDLNTGKSWGFGLNIIPINIPFGSKYVGMVSGLGFEWNGFSFSKNIDLVENNEGVITGIINNDRKYEKNKLNMTYLNIPLIIEFQLPTSARDNRFFIGAGMIGGIKIFSNTKQTFKDDGDLIKNKKKGDYQLSPFRYSATVRMGYEGLQVYANYSLAPLFEKNKGPELHPFTVGLRIGF